MEKLAYVLENDYLCSGKEYFSRVRQKNAYKKNEHLSWVFISYIC